MMETINEQLKSHFYNHPNIIQLLEENKKAVAKCQNFTFCSGYEFYWKSIFLKTGGISNRDLSLTESLDILARNVQFLYRRFPNGN